MLGTGGFGITYAAHDEGLATTVAVKEFYPAELGSRDSTMTVRPRANEHREMFEHLKGAFVREAQTLIKFRHPGIVRVLSVFEAHGTAYMVMEFERGRSLKQRLAELRRPPNQVEMDALLEPLLAALEVVHAAGYLHRDIAPDNIIIRDDGSPVLLDFGSARPVTSAMTGIVKSGYSPQEQYAANTSLQGPWTDIYALGATLYGAVTGRPPEQSMARTIDDTTQPLATAGLDGYRAEFLAGIDAALRIPPKDRPQSIAELRAIMYPLATPPATGTREPRAQATGAVPMVGGGARTLRTEAGGDVPERPVASGSRMGWLTVIGTVAAVVLAGLYLLGSRQLRSPETAAEKTRADDRGLPVSTAQAYRDGMRYLDGDGVQLDNTKARQNFERAAAQGHAGAMNRLGLIHKDGAGVVQSYVTARQWFERAIALGETNAMTNLGVLHQEGHGVPQDYAKALQWYEKAAALGHEVAMENIADLYREGHGVKPDHAMALAWYRKAAAAGLASSSNWIGRYYQEGWGVTADLAASRSWYVKAAEAGNEEGMWNLAISHDEGQGGPASPAQAARWLLDAAKAGHENAKSALAGDMSSWTAATRIAVKRDLRQRHSFSGQLDAAWGDDVRKAVETFLAR